MLNRSLVGRSRRRLQVAQLLDNVCKHLQSVANINSDILDIEEGTRLISLVSLLEKLVDELKTEKEVNDDDA